MVKNWSRASSAGAALQAALGRKRNLATRIWRFTDLGITTDGAGLRGMHRSLCFITFFPCTHHRQTTAVRASIPKGAGSRSVSVSRGGPTLRRPYYWLFDKLISPFPKRNR